MSSFPNIIFGDFGDQRKTSSVKYLPLGQIMILPDGSEYRYGQVGGTALVQGKLYQGEAYASGTGNIKDIAVIAGSAVAGTKTMSITMSATGAMATDQYADGYVFTASSAGVGGSGYSYRIKSCSSAAAGSTSVLTLYEPIEETISGGTTTVGLRVSSYKYCLLTTADTVGVSALAGVSCATAAASSYCWFQTRGHAACFTDNTTLIVGTPCTASTTVAGAVGGCSAATTLTADGFGQTAIGWVVSVAGSAEYSLIDLAIK
jgi:hypothetical protein